MSLQFFTVGFDPTTASFLTGAEMAQMVNAAGYATGYGGITLSTDDTNGNPTIPDADANSQLLTFIWLRVGNPATSGNVVTPYVWNPNQARGALYRWQPVAQASIGANSIQGYMIAPSQIDKTKINGTLDPSQVAGLSPLSQFLANTSTPSGGALTGSFLNGFTLTANAISSILQFQAGVISTNAPFSGMCISPNNIDTVLSAAAVNAVLMAISGGGAPPSWVLKQILNMAEPTISPTNQTGFVPAVQSNGTVTWVNPTTVFPAGQIFASAEVTATSLAYTSIGATLNATTWTLSYSSGAQGNLQNDNYIYLTGLTGIYSNLNGTWPVSGVGSTSLTITTSSGATGTGTSGSGTAHYAILITSSSNFNIGTIQYLGTGKYQIAFTSGKSNGSYIATADAIDTTGTSDIIKAKIIAKNSAYVQVQVVQIAGSGGAITAVDSTDVSLIVI